MGLALYRTYRPGTLAEVIGQEHVTEPLGRALDSGRVHHAYLFSGPRGCGKTSTARILARSVNCVQGPTASPCGSCRSCEELAPNGPGSIDVVELDAATHRGIDDARDLREKAIYAPAASRFKVYIIDEAHQLTNEAANALLKLVEEPPAHLRFVFATTEPDKIIPTIRSRTFHYGFRLVPARVLAEHLAAVCRQEGVRAEPAALAVVARAGAGSVRDSLSVLGQLLAGAGPEGLTYADAVTALGVTDSALLDAFVAALTAGSAADMFGVVDRVITGGHDPRRFVADVLDRLRDLVILRADPEALSRGLIEAPEDSVERMRAQASGLGLAELSHAADLVSAGLSEIKGATAPRLQLELLCARVALPGGDDPSALLARIERLERAASGAPQPAAPLRGAGRGGSAAPPSSSAGPGAGEHPVQASQPPTADVSVLGGGATGGVAPSGSGGPVPPGTPAGGPREPAGPTAPRAPAAGAAAGSGPPRRPDLRTAAAPPTTLASARPGSAAAPEPTSQPGRPADEAPPRPAASSSVGRGADDLAAVRAAWPDILTRLAADSRVAWTAFHAATPLSLSAGVLAVAVSEPGHVRAIAQRGHDERLRQSLIDVLGLDVTIDVVHDPDPARGPDPARVSSSDGAPPATAAGRSDGADEGQQPAAHARGRRGADLVRAAGSERAPDGPPDEPSADDPDLDAPGGDGLALITEQLGARPIGEIDHS